MTNTSDYSSLSRDVLEARLRDAERVCALVGWTPAHTDSPREGALDELWSHWAHAHSIDLDPNAWPDLSDAEIERLAARRDEKRGATLARLSEFVAVGE